MIIHVSYCRICPYAPLVDTQMEQSHAQYSALTLRVMPSPMALFISRDRLGSTLMGGYTCTKLRHAFSKTVYACCCRHQTNLAFIGDWGGHCDKQTMTRARCAMLPSCV